MKINGLIFTLPKEIKLFIGVFIILISIGFYSGLLFVENTTKMKPTGIEEQYLGNEDNEEAKIMKFKKSKKEMLILFHNHILSMSMIFFCTGLILSITKLPKKSKQFLMLEPFFSVLFTFGGLYLLWNGVSWIKYIVMLSGMVMTITFTLQVGIILFQLILPPKKI
jgi:hypothetical protein